jgi:hypothetical protein
MISLFLYIGNQQLTIILRSLHSKSKSGAFSLGFETETRKKGGKRRNKEP